MANISKYLKSIIDSLKPVATSGSYTDLINKPTISTAGASGSYTDLINKPTLGTAAALDVGTTANKVVQMGSDGKLPAVDGYNLINVIASGLAPSVPYSVISAKTDSNGRANFITKVSNTEISFDTNSGSTPIKITYPDGSIEANNTLPNITGISTDGTYYIVKEKGGNPYTSYLPVEDIVAPSTPATGQLWLDISVIPYIPKKWNGSSWVVTNFVKLGEFVKTSGIIGTPISYALNRTYVLRNGTSTTVNHNIGTTKIIVPQITVRCISAANGYSVGDIAILSTYLNGSANYVVGQETGIKLSRNSITFKSSTSNFVIINQSSGLWEAPAFGTNWVFDMVFNCGF